MKALKEYILEELDVDIFWLLDKWFERNDTQQQEFMNLLVQCLADKTIQTKKIIEYIKGTTLEQNLKEFVNFIDNEVTSENEKDYNERLKIILQQVINFKDKKNKYVKQYQMGSF